MAVYGIKNDWSLDLKINGYDLTPEPTQIPSVSVRSHIHQNLPSISISIADKGGQYLANNVGEDNAEIQLTMEGLGDTYSGSFLCMGGPRVSASSAGGIMLEQRGVLNHPVWMKKIIDKPFPDMKSSDVISAIASEGGLKPDVDITDDIMTWLPNNTTLSMYANFVGSRGFAGKTTGLINAVTDGSVFKYKSLEKLIQQSPVMQIGLTPGKKPYLEFEINDKAAVYNHTRGYGSTTAAPDPSGLNGPLQEFNKIQATLMNISTSVGKVVSSAVGDLGLRIEGGPLDSGNTHQKYRESIHQNKRIKSLYGFDIKVMVQGLPSPDLLDIVEFEPMDPLTQEVIQPYAGKYMITGKVRQIQNMGSFTMYTLTGQGPGIL